jgi:hypothetical protein
LAIAVAVISLAVVAVIIVVTSLFYVVSVGIAPSTLQYYYTT